MTFRTADHFTPHALLGGKVEGQKKCCSALKEYFQDLDSEAGYTIVLLSKEFGKTKPFSVQKMLLVVVTKALM